MRSNSQTTAWFIVGLLWVVALLNYFDRLMITTMRDSLRAAIPMSDEQFGSLTSVFLWVYGVLSPAGGWLADRFSRSRVIVVSLLVWSLVTWLTGHARNYEELLVARALMGISEACYIPAALALIADYHRGSTRSLATGIHMTGISAGSALGGVGGWLAQHYGWSLSFTLFGLIGIGYALLLCLWLRDPPDSPATAVVDHPLEPGQGSIWALFARPSFLFLVFYWAVLGLAGWAIVAWMPTFLKEQFHLEQGKAGLLATGYLNTATLLGVISGGFLADRWSRRNQRARILVPMLGLFVAAPGICLTALGNWLPAVLCGLVVYGFFRAFSDANTMPILCLISQPRQRATGYGVLNLFSCVAGGVGSYLGGWLKDGQVNLSAVFVAAALCLLLSGTALALIRPSHTPACDH